MAQGSGYLRTPQQAAHESAGLRIKGDFLTRHAINDWPRKPSNNIILHDPAC